jgi:hypothetical protein
VSPLDTREAMSLLARARVAKPEEHEKAALDLFIVVRDALRECAFEFTGEAEGIFGVKLANGAAYARCEGEHIFVATTGNRPWRAVDAIEYDGAIFVGTESDTFLVAAPGEPKRRRSAVAVVVERLVTVRSTVG